MNFCFRGKSFITHELFNCFIRHHTSAYPSAFRGPYPPSLPTVTSGSFSRFSPPTLIPPHPGLTGHPHHYHHHPSLTPHPSAFLTAGGPSRNHQELAAAVAAASGVGGLSQSFEQHTSNSNNSRSSLPYSAHPGISNNNNNVDQKPTLSRLSNGSSTGSPSNSSGNPSANHSVSSPSTPDCNMKSNRNHIGSNANSPLNNNQMKNNNKNHPPHVKKPLNAFMLYMKEMRAKVQSECTLKESAAINQILGKKVTTTTLVPLTFNLKFHFLSL